MSEHSSQTLLVSILTATITSVLLTIQYQKYEKRRNARSKLLAKRRESDVSIVSIATSEKKGTENVRSEDQIDATTTVKENGEEDKEVNLNLGNWENDWSYQEAQKIDEFIGSNLTSLEESRRILRRTRAVTVLANRFMLAKNEAQCYEVVSRLIGALFSVERCSYALMKDSKHWTIKQCTVLKDDYSKEMVFSYEDTGITFPLENSGIGYCADTLEELYFADCSESPYNDHKLILDMGLRTTLNVPILVGNRQFAGTLNMALKEVDAFTKLDIILIKDIAASLGIHLYSKRLQKAQAESHQVAKEYLHSMIPPSVISKIEHTLKDQSRRSSMTNAEPSASASKEAGGNNTDKDANKARVEQISRINRRDSQDLAAIATTVPTNTGNPKFSGCSPVLYAEEKQNVSIVFVDIVGFSRIARDVTPLELMDMLQNLFYRFDILCEKHGVQKLDMIGDAYIACTLDDPDGNDHSGKKRALQCLNLAKDMVRETYKCMAPTDPVEHMKIRVGIHVGDLSCGVLGQSVPKFSVFGDAVNMAARMEQTSVPMKIQVTKKFHDLIGEDEVEWEERRITSIKNMGEVETWILDPVYARAVKKF